MKTRKKLQLLQGITAIRVKAGITQLALAQYLGISKSLVSMVENNRRSLPFKALQKLAQLEIQVEQQQASETSSQFPAYKASAAVAVKRRGQQSILHCRLKELAYRLKAMQQLQEETLASLQYLDTMQRATGALPVEIFNWEKLKLLKRLQRCDETACATLRGKMTMLEMMLESYHTGEETAVTKQDPANEPVIGPVQKPASPVVREMIAGNTSHPPGIQLLRERFFSRLQLTA